MAKRKKKQDGASAALTRAEVIMKVRSGTMNATEGANILGVSRKTYYKWENRGLSAMLEGLEDRPTGRPELPARETELELLKKIEELAREKELLEKRMELKDLVHQVELDEAREKNRKGIKKKIGKTRRS